MSKLNLLIIVFLISACARDPKDVGKLVTRVEWICLKNGSNIGLTTSGKMAIVATCEVTRCMKRLLKTRKRIGDYEVMSEEIVDDNLCLRENK